MKLVFGMEAENENLHDGYEDGTSEEDLPICWVCLDGATDDHPLSRPCKCPRYSHPACLARWQLQSAGTRRETHCDFCQSRLTDWRSVLTPETGAKAPAVMNVNFDNKMYSFEVAPGPEGYRHFTDAIRKAFKLPGDSELNITFTCDEPSSGALLTLQGPGAYDAAVHCAAVSAARKLAAQTLESALSLDSDISSGSSSSSGPGVSPCGRREEHKRIGVLSRKIKTVFSELLTINR